jgi:hypothetical protein
MHGQKIYIYKKYVCCLPSFPGTGLENLWQLVRFPWNAAFTAVPVSFYFFSLNSVSILWRICYIHISDSVQTVYELPLLPNNTAVKHFSANRSGTKCWLDIYRWGAGLAVTGRIRDIGLNVLQSSFLTGSSSSAGYLHIFFLIAFLEDAFIRNIIIYIIIACINQNNALNNHYGKVQVII